jgi:hypothetical protein
VRHRRLSVPGVDRVRYAVGAEKAVSMSEDYTDARRGAFGGTRSAPNC